jgi:hypothetical protein
MWALTNGWVDMLMDNLEAPEQFIFSDCCESGAFRTGLAQNGRIAVAGAAGAGTYTYDAPEFQNGAFTYFLLEGMGMFADVESAAQHAMDGFNAWGAANDLETYPLMVDYISGAMLW